MEVAASVAGLISLADLTFRVVYKYVRGVKEAENDIKNLKREIEGLCSVLRTLHALTDFLVTEEEKDKAALSVGILDQCKETLQEIHTKVQRALTSFERKKFLKTTLQKLKWPFSNIETKELLNTLSRYKLTISMATSADSLSKLHILLNKQVEHNIKIEEAVKNIDDSTRLIANIELDKEKRRILDSFMGPTLNPRHNLDQSIELRHPTTGTWLMSSIELQSWFTEPGSLLWLNGIAGGGKTILAGLVIQKAMSKSSDEVGVAFFFCDYKNKATLHPTKILGSIATQLALQNDASFEILEKYHEDLNPPDALAAIAGVDRLASTISSMIKTFRQVLIVVDGIDECGDEMGSVTMSLAAFTTLNIPASVALFSRQEPDIGARMGDNVTEISIEAHTEDIEMYVRAELEKRIQSRQLRLGHSETKEKIAEELIGRAHGMFRWVACQLDSLCDLFTDRDRLDALKQLPRTLHDSYRRLLERVNTKPARTQKRVQLCLQFIAFFPAKLPIVELCQAVSTPEEIGDTLNKSNTVVENDIVHYCSSLIRKSADGNTFEFAHFSVQEFLESDMAGLEKYRISRQESSSLLALQCLKFVQLRNIDARPDGNTFMGRQADLVNELPFYQRAAACWPMLMRESLGKPDNPVLHEATQSLFCDSYSPKFRTWVFFFVFSLCTAVSKENAYSGDSKSSNIGLEIATDIALDMQIEPLHFASALGMPDLCLRLIEYGADPTMSCQLGPPLLLAKTSLLNALGMNAEALPVDSLVFPLLLPTAKQRNSTITCLTKEASLSDISNYASLFSNTVIVSCHLQDFGPVIDLLSSGITPTTADIELFGSYLTRWWSYRDNRFNHGGTHRRKIASNFEASLRALNRHLRDTSAFEQDWGFEFGKVLWTKAVAMELSFTRDPSLTHQEISISLETLRERIMLAISNDSPDALSNHLQDRRVSVSDSWSWNDSASQPLLHHATRFNALQCVDLLLGKHCDPYTVDFDGVPALHKIDITGDGSMIDVFLAHHVSLLTIDTLDHWNLWHICAYRADSSAEFMLKLFSAKPKETQTAVLMKTDDSLTPLSLSLSNEPDSKDDFEILEDNALSFIKHCNDVPGFWEKHDSILPEAFDFGSEKIMHRLFNLGIEPEPFIAGTFTPLHDLRANVSPSWVEFLMASFPGAVDSRYSDRLPIEDYADACVKEGTSPDEKVFEMLFSSTNLQSRDQNGSTPWEYSCSIINRSHGWYSDSNISINSDSGNAIGVVWSNYISLGAVRADEEVSGDLCSTEKGRNMIKSLLDHSNHFKLRDFSVDRRGRGLLHRIAFSDKEPHVRWLIKELMDKGVDINGIDGEAEPRYRYTPLTWHIANNSTCYAGYLLELGADVDIRENNDGSRLAHQLNAILSAAYYGNLSFLRKLLEFSQTTATETCWTTFMPLNFSCGRKLIAIECNSLHIACYKGNYEMVKFFVEEKLLDYGTTTKNGYTPLHLAAVGGQSRIINYLIAQGQEVDVLTSNRVTPLHYAAANGHFDATEALLCQHAQGSISALFWTPRIAASEAGHQNIVELLDNRIRTQDESESELIRAHRHKKKLLGQMKEAIVSNHVLECRALASNGCPMNDLISQSNDITPLRLALTVGHCELVRTLLDLGASTLTHCDPGDCYIESVINYAALYSELVDILPTLVDHYVEQGGDLADGPDSPIFFAAKSNVEGMRILLNHLRENNKKWGGRCDYEIEKVLERRHSMGVFEESYFDKVAALHVAVFYDQIEIAQLLLESGADVNSTSIYGFSPIDRSMSSEMTSLLMRFGKEPWLGLDMFPQRFNHVVPDWRQLLAIRHLQGPLNEYLRSDSKLANYLLGFGEGHCFFLNSDHQLLKLEPFPWYQISRYVFDQMLFLRSNFRLFQRRFSQPVFKQWLNLEPDRGWSPLCRAASMEYLDVIENCLSMGAYIDFEGCFWGSALIIASACGKLASVKRLVRAGAKIDYIGSNGHTSALSVTKSEVVKQWLLVGQFVEQKKIVAATESDTNCLQHQAGRRSGIAKIKVRLAELYRRRYEESSLDYLRRLELLKLEMRGKVPYYTDGVIYEDYN
ncbi:hypothetical protein EDB82DRAFT_427570 [Fusarium venenatum]|uniref:uncharacterized protein n=1 Tax=Fusarium venenatum TaxID=56646 RepID=UPI001D637871|nr:hypothetical protein EDB82DRAFT_427570 [Fusarium venenatum]